MSASTPSQLIATKRKLTEHGQTTIPATIRHEMGFKPGDDVKFIWDGEDLVVVKSE